MERLPAGRHNRPRPPAGRRDPGGRDVTTRYPGATFYGADGYHHHVATIAYTLIETAKLNGVDPQAWLADTLARIPDYKITRVDDLLLWNRAK